MHIVAVIPRRGGRDPDVYDGIIAKVGRRWITFTRNGGLVEDRFDAETMCIYDGWIDVGRVYNSREEYLESMERAKLWADLYRRMPLTPPKSMTAERIRQLIEEVSKQNRKSGQ